MGHLIPPPRPKRKASHPYPRNPPTKKADGRFIFSIAIIHVSLDHTCHVFELGLWSLGAHRNCFEIRLALVHQKLQDDGVFQNLFVKDLRISICSQYFSENW
jgi:hypothetical protein